MFLFQVKMLSKRKSGKSRVTYKDGEETSALRLKVSQLTMADYERHHYDKDRLKELAMPMGKHKRNSPFG